MESENARMSWAELVAGANSSLPHIPVTMVDSKGISSHRYWLGPWRMGCFIGRFGDVLGLQKPTNDSIRGSSKLSRSNSLKLQNFSQTRCCANKQLQFLKCFPIFPPHWIGFLGQISDSKPADFFWESSVSHPRDLKTWDLFIQAHVPGAWRVFRMASFCTNQGVN